ncbi:MULTISPECIES: right-handed parallel beta-helix repeat-containing protein [unclassified Streptomyces]|uniref:right-handed parallel beta-helix repeat-containing protein n=1 Tax=unclassified Streptomyces TaxID=2593676 RepID=UPI000DC786A6|nr:MULTISPECIES: right-handed parallel beta-helix repeat-containing protein [unclassified Streptomyces]AWZ07631.1 plasmid stabilization protein [Streptomyces sp. ICC4]AWZ15381.1 plasmid stabilization protein [Streptomyces sp. ICC1]
MRSRLRALLAAATVLAALASASCAPPTDDSSGSSGSSGSSRGPLVLRVPADFPSLQKAVDRARPGDLVLAAPGTYRESVTLATPRVVLRGADRNSTVIDGEFRRANGITVTGAGSAVENLTVRNHLANGLLITGVTDASRQAGAGGGKHYERLDTRLHPPLHGFRASYVTAHNNALYGIYAFDASEGVIEHSYASGHADSGIYVGQCSPCRTVVRDNTVEHNAVGLEVTNASQDLYFLGNLSRLNRVGAAVNSNDLESLAPQRGAVFAGNTLVDNNDAASPEQADGGFGIGIGIGGGRDNVLERNLIGGNRHAGVLLADVLGYPVTGNRVGANRVTSNGTDLILAAAGAAGNCFAGNGEMTASPDGLAGAARCGQPAAPLSPAAGPPPPSAPAGLSFRRVPAPAPQPSMPGPGTAPGSPAAAMPPADPARYPLPSRG